MASPTIRVMGLHGLGHVEATEAVWRPTWEATIRGALGAAGAARRVEFLFPRYDDLFARRDVSYAEVLRALGELLRSGFVHGILGGTVGRGWLDLPEALRATAGMVAQWVRDDALRRATRKRVADAVAAFRPDVLAAHSLGSLIAYDTATDPATSRGLKDAVLLTMGSQVGHPFVRAEFGGYLTPAAVKRWVNVHNPEDRVFTTPIALHHPTFVERTERFGPPTYGSAHDAVGYLASSAAAEEVWGPLACETSGAPSGARGGPSSGAASGAVKRAGGRAARSVRAGAAAPDRRALLVGIDAYPAPRDRLRGCVNDAFLMSAVLQESGFAASQIRLLLDGRATSATVRDRLDWLLDDARSGDVRVFYFSGHGAQVPAYGADEVVDRVDEVLVTHDFDGSDPRRTGIVDDHLVRRYAQLPYDAHFVMMLDCCHAGGMARAGGGRVRGRTPPDDVRHRGLRWDVARATWVDRDLRDLNPGATDRARGNGRFFGRVGATGHLGVQRLGRGAALRRLSDAGFAKVTAARGHLGPYLPMILEACAEGELSFEYEHGSHSYGAFTYTVARILRQHRAMGRTLSFRSLVALAAAELPRLGYRQTPQLTGPSKLRASSVPWSVATPPARRRR